MCEGEALGKAVWIRTALNFNDGIMISFARKSDVLSEAVLIRVF